MPQSSWEWIKDSLIYTGAIHKFHSTAIAKGNEVCAYYCSGITINLIGRASEKCSKNFFVPSKSDTFSAMWSIIICQYYLLELSPYFGAFHEISPTQVRSDFQSYRGRTKGQVL